jgi:hypothetical protein
MLDIIDAKYGALGVDKDKVDVTDNVKRIVSSDKQSISVVVGPTGLGVKDPSAGNPKELVVKYNMNGDEHTETVKDGFTFAAAVPQKVPQTYAQFTAGVYSSFWSNMAGAVVLFISVFSVGLAFGLGSYVGNPFVWLIVAILFPYGSFWLILAIIVIMRALSAQDFIKPFF